MGCVFAYVIILTFVGPEKLGHRFGIAHDRDMADAAGEDAMAAVVHRREAMGAVERDETSSGSERDVEKNGARRREVEAKDVS